MTRRQVSSTRRGGSFPLTGVLHSKSRSSPLLSVCLVRLGTFRLIIYAFGGSVQRAIPVLKKAYGGNMKKVLHVGPESFSVVSKLLREEETDARGLKPYDIEDADRNCKALVQKDIVRLAVIKFPLPYRAVSFSHVIVSDALDYLSPKYLNKTLPELARVSVDGIVIFTGYPGQQRAKLAQLSKFGRPAKMGSSSWWKKFFTQTSLEENDVAAKKFEQAASKLSYKPAYQVFLLTIYIIT